MKTAEEYFQDRYNFLGKSEAEYDLQRFSAWDMIDCADQYVVESKSEQEVYVIIKESEDYYWGHAEHYPHCTASGSTMDEALQELKNRIKICKEIDKQQDDTNRTKL